MKSSIKLLSALAIAGFLFGPTIAKAADYEAAPIEEDHFYLGVFGGWAWADDFRSDAPIFERIDTTQQAPLTEVTLGEALSWDPDSGWIAGIYAGWHVLPQLRAEIEGSFQRHNIDEVTAELPTGDESSDVDADLDVAWGLLSAWYDFNHDGVISPYIGGGIGVGWANFETETPTDLELDDRDYAFAFQLGAGVRWGVTDAIALNLGYRFRGIEGLDFHDRAETDPGVFTDVRLSDMDFHTHIIMAGIELSLF